MKVTVTTEHIRNGVPEHCGLCPIALALRDMGYKAVVECEDVKIDGYMDILPLPESATSFVYDYDHGRPVSPFEFELDEPW